MSLRRFSADREGAKPLARQGSAQDGCITEELIKSATQRFDVGIAFKLSLCNKGLTRMSGLDNCENLVELNLSGNGIAKIDGLERTMQLRKLVLASNKLTLLESIWHLSKLEALHVQDNRIAGLESLFLQSLAALPSLRALYLQNLDRSQPNPVCRTQGYKAAVLAALPGLNNMDGERCPQSISYAELAEEAERLKAAPPPKKDIVLPDLAPWLQGVAMDLNSGPAGEEAGNALQERYGAVVKAVDECEVLNRVLRDEVVPKGRLAAAAAAAAEAAHGC